MEPQHNQPIPEKTDSEAPQAPKNRPQISLPAAIVTAAAIIGLAIIFAFGQKAATTKTPEPQGATQPTSVPSAIATVRSDDYLRGQRTAPVAVIEYSDSDCPFCGQFHTTMQEVLALYGEKVSWTYRFFPLTSLHPNAYTESLALACVGELGGQTAFWDYLDTIMAVTLSADTAGKNTLIKLAAQHGVNDALLRTCMNAASSTARVDAGISEAGTIGARGTPFSVAVNTTTGEQVVIPGAVGIDYMKQVIDSLLE